MYLYRMMLSMCTMWMCDKVTSGRTDSQMETDENSIVSRENEERANATTPERRITVTMCSTGMKAYPTNRAERGGQAGTRKHGRT